MCVTSYKLFAKIVLDRDILQVEIRSRNDFHSEKIELNNESYRHAAYRQFIHNVEIW